MEGAVQVRAGDRLERGLGRHRPEVHDGVDAVDRGLHRRLIGQVGGDEGLGGDEVVGRGEVGEPQLLEAVAQRGPQHGPDPPAGTGDQHASWLHGRYSTLREIPETRSGRSRLVKRQAPSDNGRR